MNSDTQNKRSNISRAARKLLRKDMIFEERVYQAIESVDFKSNAPNVVEIWKALSKVLPSIHVLYSALNINHQELFSLLKTYSGFRTKAEDTDKN